MPSITMDGHTLSIDGRRLWVVSGTVAYTQTPRALWADRLRAAKQAGMNTIETPVVWSAHEPREGKISFDGDLDLPAFIKLAHSLDLYVIVRIGPYVCEGLDLGGMPAWLPASAKGKLRTHTADYLACVSRFISAVCDKIANLQVTGGPNRRGKGPIIAIQAEHRWLCGENGAVSGGTVTGGVPKEGTDYLSELARFLREGGINVPVIANNDLYHAAEGQIEAWSGRAHLHANLRQLRMQRPSHPRLVMSLRGAKLHDGMDAWGHTPRPGLTPNGLVRTIAEVLAAGAQFNIASFAPGTRWGFSAGRSDDGPGRFITPNSSAAAISETGARGAMYHAVKRVSTFASTFERLFCGLDSTYQPVTLAIDGVGHQSGGTKPKPAKASLQHDAARASVVHCQGSQGSIAFVFGHVDEHAAPKPQTVKLVLPDGSTLPVFLGAQGAAWVLLDTHLGGRATLDYCNVCPFALVGRSLVCYGPAGTPALLSINGSAIDLMIPSGDKPLVQEIEGISLALCNEETINTAIAAPDAVWFGVKGLDEAGQPIAADGVTHLVRMGTEGDARTASVKATPVPSVKIALANWSSASTSAQTEGSSPRFARIDGPATLDELGTPHGYGWMRLRFKSAAPRKAKVGLFESADRIHLWCNAQHLGVFGEAAGAAPLTDAITIPIAKGDNSIVALIDNLGRFTDGSALGESKGLFGQMWEVSPLKPAAPKLESGDPIQPLRLKSPIIGLQWGDPTDPRRLTWKLQHRKKSPIFICIDPPEGHEEIGPGVILINDKQLVPFLPTTAQRIRIDDDLLSRGTNTLQIAIVGDMEHAMPALKGAVKIFEGETCLSAEKAEWAFAKWEPPAAAAFEAAKKGAAPARSRDHTPLWWRGEFVLPAKLDCPITFDAAGLSKGQIYLNGKNLSRYFTATAAGKPVGPQTRFWLPEPWLKLGETNEIMLFDEHGFAPSSCRIIKAD